MWSNRIGTTTSELMASVVRKYYSLTFEYVVIHRHTLTQWLYCRTNTYVHQHMYTTYVHQHMYTAYVHNIIIRHTHKLETQTYFSDKSPPSQRHQYIYMRGTLLVAQLVEALRCKSESRWFDSRFCHWNSPLPQSFRPHYGPGVDSQSNRKRTRNISLG